jgi:copper(I)-binding protein/cytochrome oxidase Cu insertion factor (SCO1/SenC/PrrC family)
MEHRIPQCVYAAGAALFLYLNAPLAMASSPWGANYFPNVELTTQDGEKVRFFDDLIKDKVVAINFIYTTCPDTCPLETAQLVNVQQLLGDRVGKDVFFYSITIDPANDTPEVLKEYRERFSANWTFLTGDNADIIRLRRKLGLYIEEIQDGSNNHNVSMIIGNQATGRWMKRSPFENSYVLADQIGNWLSGWKSVQPDKDYANAPALRSISLGEQLFRTRCTSCHTVTGSERQGALGPDLLGVTGRRDREWLLNWLRAPDQMLDSGDPIAVALFEQYNQLKMPNMRLNREEAVSLLEYISEETQRLGGEPSRVATRTPVMAEFTVGQAEPAGDVVAIMNAWIRETDAGARVHAGYMTLVNVGDDDVSLVSIESAAYENIEVHEMKPVEGLMQMQEVTDMVIPARDQVQFAPGGMHLMLKGPHKHFTSGERVDMTLTFATGERQTVTVTVASR